MFPYSVMKSHIFYYILCHLNRLESIVILLKSLRKLLMQLIVVLFIVSVLCINVKVYISES